MVELEQGSGATLYALTIVTLMHSEFNITRNRLPPFLMCGDSGAGHCVGPLKLPLTPALSLERKSRDILLHQTFIFPIEPISEHPESPCTVHEEWQGGLHLVFEKREDLRFLEVLSARDLRCYELPAWAAEKTLVLYEPGVLVFSEQLASS